ncbi:MAG: hypothetical protein JRN04_04720 [Nitrososphaerota archaeon]|nr:hypothetical protein [Nitrososphaerota archaeon]
MNTAKLRDFFRREMYSAKRDGSWFRLGRVERGVYSLAMRLDVKLESAVLLRSLAVAVKTLLERNEDSDQDASQISGRRIPVSGLLRHVSDAPEPMAVPAHAQGRGKPTGFSRG